MGSIEAAAGTTSSVVGRDVATALGGTTSGASRLLREVAGAPVIPDVPVRDLGIPFGALALLGAYLASTRWLDRGGLPMILQDGQEDDVQLVL